MAWPHGQCKKSEKAWKGDIFLGFRSANETRCFSPDQVSGVPAMLTLCHRERGNGGASKADVLETTLWPAILYFRTKYALLLEVQPSASHDTMRHDSEGARRARSAAQQGPNNFRLGRPFRHEGARERGSAREELELLRPTPGSANLCCCPKGLLR
jgi:hypothetical protein